MKQSAILFILVVMSSALFGQGSIDKPTRKLILCGVQIGGGPNHYLNYAGTYDQFQPLATNTDILTKHPFEGYHMYPRAYWYNSGGVSASLSFRVARPGSTAKENGPLFRLGIRYQGAGYHFLDASRTEHFTVDTLFNSQGDQVGYMDSTIWNRYSMKYNTYQLHLDVSMIFSTSPRHRVSLFGGIGIAGGLSTSAWVQIGHQTNIFKESVIQNQGSTFYWQSFGDFDSDHEIEPTSGNIGGFVYLPMGLKVKLGKRGGLAEHLQLFYEIQPGIHAMHIRGSNTYIQTGIHQNFGFSVNW